MTDSLCFFPLLVFIVSIILVSRFIYAIIQCVVFPVYLHLHFKWSNCALLVQVSVKTDFNYALFICQYILFHISNNSDLMPVTAVYYRDIILSDNSHYYFAQTVSRMSGSKGCARSVADE
jgi:hypothetical protein